MLRREKYDNRAGKYKSILLAGMNEMFPLPIGASQCLDRDRVTYYSECRKKHVSICVTSDAECVTRFEAFVKKEVKIRENLWKSLAYAAK